MKTVTISDKSFEKIVGLIRADIKGYEQQIRDCKYILTTWESGNQTQCGKSYYQNIVRTAEKKKTESEYVLKQLTNALS